MPKDGFYDSAGVRLHYLDWGGRGWPLVLLAGLGDSACMYGGLAPALARRFRVMGLTRRGHGRSEHPDSGYDLDTLVDDILRFLDKMGIERPILVGHSAAGLEMPRLAVRYPDRVEVIVFLDALFPPLDPEPDLSGDPTYQLLPRGEPTAEDLASQEAYYAFAKRARPAWTNFWSPVIEAELMERVVLQEDGSLAFTHSDLLMDHIFRLIWPHRDPQYGQVRAPMLAIVPDGDWHQAVSPDAPAELRELADSFWREKLLPWLRQRTETFQRAAPAAQVVLLDSPYHHIHLAQEDETLEAILAFTQRYQ